MDRGYGVFDHFNYDPRGLCTHATGLSATGESFITSIRGEKPPSEQDLETFHQLIRSVLESKGLAYDVFISCP